MKPLADQQKKKISEDITNYLAILFERYKNKLKHKSLSKTTCSVTVKVPLFVGINFRGLGENNKFWILEFVDLTTLSYKQMENFLFLGNQISWFTKPTKIRTP